MKFFRWLIVVILIFCSFATSTYALTGIVNVNDSLSLRSSASSSSALKTSFYNGTELEILSTNAGSGNGCDDNWYKVKYGNYTGYSCGTFINLVSSNMEDGSYSKSNYSKALAKDGSIMCYEDTGAVTLRDKANGSRLSGKTVNCGDLVNIVDITETKGKSCPYWYKVDNGKYSGYLCGYFVNTTKLSSTASNYYNNNSRGDTIDNYKAKLTKAGFPDSYHSYLLEIHARYPEWNFVAEKIDLTFDEVIDGESGNGANLLEWKAFGEGYTSTASHSYNPVSNKFYEYNGEPGYYNASKEAIAYYMDPRNYLNEKYIFAFESLRYNNSQTKGVISSIISGLSFFDSIYAKKFSDSTGSASGDIVKTSSSVGISAVHVASRIKQEMTGCNTSDSRLGGSFKYNGSNKSGYYNFFNIKSGCTNCSSIYAGYAYENGWDTPYKGLYGGAKFMYGSYISLNQDTIYYEKFDVSTSNGNYTHQYMQNLAAPIQEGGIKYVGYVNGSLDYFNTAITFTIPVYKNMPNYAVKAPSLGNPNNYLSSLKVNGVSVNNFSYATNNYNVSVSSSTSSVKIAGTAMVSTSKVSGTGTKSLTGNTTSLVVKVKAQNGKYRKYTINVTKKDSKPTTVADSMNHSGFKYNDNYMFGVEVGTNVSTLIGNVNNYNDLTSVEIKSSNGNVKTNDSFRTGDKVNITGSDGSKTYTVVIYGDIDGDGRISAVDYMKIKNYIMKASNLKDCYLVAADTNRDGKVTAVDYMNVKNNILGTNKIVQ